MKKIDPLKLGLLDLTPDIIKKINPIVETTIFVASSKNFHPNGLYSTEIFGLQGSDGRMSTYGRIDLKGTFIHPTIFGLLIKAKKIYSAICKGTEFAVFDNKMKDFVKSDSDKARTGYAFFLEYLPKLVVEDSGSTSRALLNNLLKRYRKNLTMTNLIVLPAGLRDYSEDEQGTPTTDEINDIYRKIISASRFAATNNSDILSYGQQTNLQELTVYIDNLIFGKHKLINKRVLRRAVHGGTRNVLTSQLNDFRRLDDGTLPRADNTLMGLYQFLKGTGAKAQFNIINGWLKKVFPSDTSNMVMMNQKTGDKVDITIDVNLYEKYMTSDGVNKQINKLFSKDNRNKALEHEGNWFGMYLRTGDTFMYGQSLDEFPEGTKLKDLKPLTFFLLAYIAVYDYSLDSPVVVSRYPVLTEGGIWPNMVYLKPTTTTTIVYHVDKEDTKLKKYRNFPDFNSGYFNSLAIPDMNLAAAGADFDGDKSSANILSMDESIKEIKTKLGKAQYYLSVNGTMQYSPNEHIDSISLLTFTQE